jgi:hypothetical protein
MYIDMLLDEFECERQENIPGILFITYVNLLGSRTFPEKALDLCLSSNSY